MKILVTGGCGYIGSATARFLHRNGHEVTVVDNLSEGHRAAWSGEFHELELLDRGAVHNFLEGRSFDGVIHFAARAYVGESVLQPLRYWRANVLPVIFLCEKMEGTPFVFSSTCATYGNPITETLSEDHPQNPVNPYGNTKLAVERLLRDRDLAGQGKFAALRYFNASGAEEDANHGEAHNPETHLIPLAVQAALGQREPLTVFGNDWDTPDGTCIRDYIHILDLASAHLAALKRLSSGGNSGAWNIGTGSGVSVQEILKSVERVTGKPVPFVSGSRREGDPSRLVAEASRARTELEWVPEWTDLDALVETAVNWHRKNPKGYQES
ncbi:MAG: UDP-glucose 4-epimerase GalE [Planctomycetota bacterium]|jgi:UDP-glucose-4-epimerase GalE|nr:UDP-glucose 4-epimerase GalE [Planctomycetota bacterium]MDP6941777.1 UDP-glucose 4-epimerase GalE [Planctomycetota bacterium]